VISHADEPSPLRSVWSLESGVWSLASGVWSLESGVWSLESGVWSLESGVWSLESNIPTEIGLPNRNPLSSLITFTALPPTALALLIGLCAPSLITFTALPPTGGEFRTTFPSLDQFLREIRLERGTKPQPTSGLVIAKHSAELHTPPTQRHLPPASQRDTTAL